MRDADPQPQILRPEPLLPPVERHHAEPRPLPVGDNHQRKQPHKDERRTEQQPPQRPPFPSPTARAAAPPRCRQRHLPAFRLLPPARLRQRQCNHRQRCRHQNRLRVQRRPQTRPVRQVAPQQRPQRLPRQNAQLLQAQQPPPRLWRGLVPQVNRCHRQKDAAPEPGHKPPPRQPGVAERHRHHRRAQHIDSGAQSQYAPPPVALRQIPRRQARHQPPEPEQPHRDAHLGGRNPVLPLQKQRQHRRNRPHPEAVQRHNDAQQRHPPITAPQRSSNPRHRHQKPARRARLPANRMRMPAAGTATAIPAPYRPA